MIFDVWRVWIVQIIYAFWIAFLFLWILLLYKKLSREKKKCDQTFRDFQRAAVDKARFYTMWQEAQHDLNRKGKDIAEALGQYRGHEDLISAIKRFKLRLDLLEEERREQQESSKPIWENPHD